jgi:glutamate dehydrogenase (NAD(P)+)
VVGIPYGGGKGGVVVDPKKLTSKELEHLTRRYATEISVLIGPERDIPAPDVDDFKDELLARLPERPPDERVVTSLI